MVQFLLGFLVLAEEDEGFGEGIAEVGSRAVILRPEQLLTALPEAMRVLVDPAATGAVTIALPQDVQPQAWGFPTRFFEPRIWCVERRPARYFVR